jgi:large subunit ribosomal protein L25
MEVVRLIAQRRHQTGKGVARQLRRAGQLPAVLYGRGDSVAVAVPEKDLVHIQRSGAGENTILDFEVQGDEPETCNAILRDVQLDPLTGTPLHADFYRLDMSQPITVSVPLEFINVPEERLKIALASWLPLVRDVMVECLPRDIPEHITVDLEALEVGETLHAGALTLPQGVTLLMDEEEAIVTTTVVTAEEEEVEAAEAEEEAGTEVEAAASESEEEAPAS